jgi:hypothetical protein
MPERLGCIRSTPRSRRGFIETRRFESPLSVRLYLGMRELFEELKTEEPAAAEAFEVRFEEKLGIMFPLSFLDVALVTDVHPLDEDSCMIGTVDGDRGLVAAPADMVLAELSSLAGEAEATIQTGRKS